MATLGESLYRRYRTSTKLLDEACGFSFSSRITSVNIRELTEQHILKYLGIYYRFDPSSLNDNNIKIYKIANKPDIIYNNFVDESTTPSLTVNFIENEVVMFSVPIYKLQSSDLHPHPACSEKICNVKYVYHGTSYPFPAESAGNPYNFYGNWYSLGLDLEAIDLNIEIPTESSSYRQYDKPFVIYRYRIKKPMNLLYLDNEESNAYILAHIQHFEVKSNGSSWQIKDDFTIRSDTGSIEKYNYKRYKNLLDRSKTPPDFTPGYYDMKTASSGDGDKSLASKLCSTINETMSDKLNGWIIRNLAHLMSCNYQDYLELDGCYLFIRDEDTHKELIQKMITINPLLKSRSAGFGAHVLYVDTANIPTFFDVVTRALNILEMEKRGKVDQKQAEMDQKQAEKDQKQAELDRWLSQKDALISFTQVQSGGSKRFYKFNLL
jgi:hypothetical protein